MFFVQFVNLFHMFTLIYASFTLIIGCNVEQIITFWLTKYLLLYILDGTHSGGRSRAYLNFSRTYCQARKEISAYRSVYIGTSRHPCKVCFISLKYGLKFDRAIQLTSQAGSRCPKKSEVSFLTFSTVFYDVNWTQLFSNFQIINVAAQYLSQQ